MSTLPQGCEGQAFHPSFGNEVVHGRIRFHGWALRFESGETVLEIPMDRLRTELGAGDDDRIFFGDPQQPELRLIALDSSLLADAQSAQAMRLREQLSARLTRQELTRRLKIVAWVAGACVLLAWLGMMGSGWMVRVIVARVPPEWERKMGVEAMEELRNEVTFVEDTNQVAWLTAAATPLLRAMPGGPAAYRFHLADEEMPNAFALPGGDIVVTTGMLRLVKTPEELLGTIAHEVAHVTQKHHTRTVVASAGPYMVFRVFLGGQGGVLGVLAGSSAFLIQQSFSQEYEIEADDVGWEYMLKANLDPRGMTDLFRKLDAYEDSQQNLRLIPQAFNSHPTTVKRIARLEEKWRKLPNKERFAPTKPAVSR